MKRLFAILSAALLAALLLPSRVVAQVGAPRIFFTDMDSGPNSGGENNNGTILSIFGKRFGATQGSSTVTIGGGVIAQVKIWSDTKITVAIGAAAQSGPVVVTVSGVASNTNVTFTVRPGNIRCIATNGNDNNSGLWGSCWQNVQNSVFNSNLAAGDIIYVMNGVTATGDTGYSCNICIYGKSGTAQAPIALVGYPGTTAVLGSINEQLNVIRVPNLDAVNADYWTIADLHLQGESAMGISGHPGTTGWRVIGNDMTCPNGQDRAYDGCFEGDDMNFVKLYGNTVHHVGTNVSVNSITKLYHAVYWSTDSNHIDAGWNEIGPSNACRGIQFHSSPIGGATGFDQFDLHVHDNYIHDIRCDGINFATVDPSQGTVEAYNNIIVHAGAGPDPPDGASDYACIYSAGTTNTGSPGKGQVKVYNNTMYDCNARQPHDTGSGGALASFDSGAGLSILAQNNIMDVLSSENYFEDGSVITCDHNLFFGAGAAPGNCTNNVTSDPLFTNSGARDFHLQSGSPAIDAGINTGLTMDIDGNPRPIGAGFDLGAYEFPGAKSPQQPNPPKNLKATVK